MTWRTWCGRFRTEFWVLPNLCVDWDNTVGRFVRVTFGWGDWYVGVSCSW